MSSWTGWARPWHRQPEGSNQTRPTSRLRGLGPAAHGDPRRSEPTEQRGTQPFFFARNGHPDDSEFTGPTFSQDKRILFANIQSPGHVFAIQGPFTRQR
jgi:hypothetical protein